jgi:hypothetical protein
MADGWYLIDFARSRYTNPGIIPVRPLGCRYDTGERAAARGAKSWCPAPEGHRIMRRTQQIIMPLKTKN